MIYIMIELVWWRKERIKNDSIHTQFVFETESNRNRIEYQFIKILDLCVKRITIA